MPVFSPDLFTKDLMPQTRLLALDVGSKTIGLASGMWGSDLVMPLKTIVRSKFAQDAQALLGVIRDYDVRGLVIGWPLQLDGQPGRRCQSVRDFTAEMERRLADQNVSLPIVFWDERFSTAAGDKLVYDPVNNLGTKRDQVIDAFAAQKILEDFLECNGGV